MPVENEDSYLVGFLKIVEAVQRHREVEHAKIQTDVVKLRFKVLGFPAFGRVLQVEVTVSSLRMAPFESLPGQRNETVAETEVVIVLHVDAAMLL
jgi:hypothetical protein